MVRRPDSPGPGEEGSFSQKQAEGAIESAASDAILAAASSPFAFAAVADWRDPAESLEDPARVLGRASVEYGLRVRLEGISSEPRLDRSAGDLQRESALDSKQDDAGPLSDKN